MRRKLKWIALVVVIATVIASTFLLVSGWRAFGQKASGDRLARMQNSPQWGEGVFENPQPLWNDWASPALLTDRSPHGSPTARIPVVQTDPNLLAAPAVTGLRITWFGHSSFLLELDGVRVLADPTWGERSSPFQWMGPKRWYPPPIELEELPPIDAVVISHDHYDHLDYTTLDRIKHWETRFVVPLGVGSHLAYWGVAPDRIVELDWWESTRVGEMEIVSVPSRHASGRFLTDYMHTLWSGFVFVGPRHRVYYSGDTGMFAGMQDIAQRYGPFDVTMIEVGAYHRTWPDWHIGPEQAVRAHRILRGKVFMPVHWGMWNLALHGWTEPAERVLAAARRTQTVLAMPRPGESIEPAKLPAFQKWWPDVPWETAQEHPIVSTRLGPLANP